MRYINSIKYCFAKLKFVLDRQCAKCNINVCNSGPYTEKVKKKETNIKYISYKPYSYIHFR